MDSVGTAQIDKNKLFGSLSDLGSLEDCAIVCRECSQIRSTCRVRRSDCQGQLLPLFLVSLAGKADTL